MYDGTCDQTKELEKLTGIMPNDDKWVISSSGHHMFVSFNVALLISHPGFTAKIYQGNEFKYIKIRAIKKCRFIFSQLCKCN